MEIRFKEGYKNNLSKFGKEKSFKEKIKKECALSEKEYNNNPYVGYYCNEVIPRGYYINENGAIKTIHNKTKRYNFKTPKHDRKLRRRYFNNFINEENINVTDIGKTYNKVLRNNFINSDLYDFSY